MTEMISQTDSSKAPWPHCDQRVLHAPGECVYCDKRQDLQAIRASWMINFTGHDEPNKQTCPAVYLRDLATINRWYGNRPVAPIAPWVRKAVADIMQLHLLEPGWADDAAKIIAEAERTR